MGGNGHPGNGGGGGSGYYGGNWTKKASVRGGNSGASRSWTYGTNLTQTVTTDGKNGYIRIFGRGGSTGNNPIVTPDEASVWRGTYATQQGLFFDLREFPTTQDVLIWHNVTNNSSGNFLSLYICEGVGNTYGYPLRGDSDTERGNVGTVRITVDENSGGGNSWIQGGKIYIFRTHDHNAGSSGVYMGGEDQGGTAGIASGGMWDITVHDSQPSNGDNNEGGSADMRVEFAILDARRNN